MICLLKMKKFIKFSLIWYSQQFAIPFWVVGHVHLHLVTYQDWVVLLKEVKFVDVKEGVRWVCKECKALLGWPGQTHIDKWSNK